MKIIIFIALFFAVLPAVSSAAPLSVKDSIYTERVRNAVVLPKSDRVIFEIETVIEDGNKRAAVDRRRKAQRLYITVPGRVDAVPLFTQDLETDYHFISSTPLSPDGDRIAVFAERNSVRRLGIYDIEASELELLDLASGFPSVFWLSSEKILFVGALDRSEFGQFGGGHSLPSSRMQSYRRDLVDRGYGPTSDIAGSGRYLQLSDRRVSRDVVIADVVTGETTTVAQTVLDGVLGGLSLSPGRRYFVGTSRKELTSSAGIPSYRSSLELINLSSMTVISLTDSSVPSGAVLAWSDTGDRLVYATMSVAHGVRCWSYHLYEPEKMSAAEIEGSTVELRRWCWDKVDSTLTGSRGSVFAQWQGEHLLIRNPWNESVFEVIDFAAETAPQTRSLWIRGFSFAHSPKGIYSVFGSNILVTSLIGDERVVYRQKSRRPGRLLTTSRIGISMNDRNSLIDITALPAVIEFENSYIVLNGDSSGSDTLASEIRSDIFSVAAITSNGVVYTENIEGLGTVLKLCRSPGGSKGEEVALFNQHLAGVSELPDPVELFYASEDGKELRAWMHLPPLPENRREFVDLPLLVVPYAGKVFGDSSVPAGGLWGASIWDSHPHIPTSPAVLASAGYAVLVPSIPLDTSDTNLVDQIERAVEGAISEARKTGLVSSDKLAVIGHSFGGYSALSIATRIDNIDAVVASASLSNLTSDYGEFAEAWRGGDFARHLAASYKSYESGQKRMQIPPWRDLKRYFNNSPLFFVNDIDAPIMLIHGSLDNISLSQPEQMFASLMREEADAILIRYWGEGHIILGVQNTEDMWTRVFDFLEDNGVTPGPKTAH